MPGYSTNTLKYIVNTFLLSGVFPQALKTAVIKCKKACLDPEIMK